MRWIEHVDADALTAAVADRLEQIVANALARGPRARLALAGGSTPLPSYRRFATAALEWDRVDLLPGDERWVAEDHDACNLAALQRCFADVPARFHPLVPPNPGPEPDLATAIETFAGLDETLDACLLGMGADGHFASLFPGAAGLERGLDRNSGEAFIVIHPDPLPLEAPFARVSLTLSAILTSRDLLLAIRGAAKRDVLEQSMPDHGSALPIARLLADGGNRLEIHWSP